MFEGRFLVYYCYWYLDWCVLVLLYFQCCFVLFWFFVEDFVEVVGIGGGFGGVVGKSQEQGWY